MAEEYATKANPLLDIVLLPQLTMEFELGWVFFYQTREYVETGDMMQMMEGNDPLIINKFDGSLHVTGTGLPIEKHIRDYIKSRQ